MLHDFSFPLYELLDPGSTLSFFTSLVASKCNLLPEILHEPLLFNTPIGDSVRAESVNRDLPIIVLNKFTYANLIELTMLEFLYNFGYGLAL